MCVESKCDENNGGKDLFSAFWQCALLDSTICSANNSAVTIFRQLKNQALFRRILLPSMWLVGSVFLNQVVDGFTYFDSVGFEDLGLLFLRLYTCLRLCINASVPR